MKRRRLIEAENTRLRDENQRMAKVIDDQALRIVELKAERDEQATLRARAEAGDVTPGMCRTLAQCAATSSAADAWRHRCEETQL